jgi:uncharacterized Zn finger protein
MTGASAAWPGHTWWGRAWLDALEQRAQLDPNRLPRGRDYARTGAVVDLVLTPGEARARVQGRRSQPYETRIRVRQFTEQEWDRVLDSVSAQLGRAAALLDGQLPPEVADDAAVAGLDLLPGTGEVGPRCNCPDDADPCKHAAAVCYLIADALDADPFALLLLRGRTRGEVLAGLRTRRRGMDAHEGSTPGRAISGASARQEEAEGDRGVDARAAFAAAPRSGPVPTPPLPPGRPGHPAPLPVDPPSSRGGLREDLVALASDAVARAWELAVGLSTDGGLGLDADADLARRAARALGTPAFATLAARCQADGRELARMGLAWRHGGTAGLGLLNTEWDPVTDAPDAADLLKAAQVALEGVTGLSATIIGNRITAGRAQLRLGHDLLWYPYAMPEDDWEPAGHPQPDPVRAVETL